MITININNIGAKVRATPLTGLSVASGGVIIATDTVLQAFGKLQHQITNIPQTNPGGANRQVQFNNGGVFSGSPELTFFGTNRLSIGYAAPVDAGFRLDVNGDVRFTGPATIRGMTINEAGNVYTFRTVGSNGSFEFTGTTGTQLRFRITNLGDAVITRDLLLNTTTGGKIGGAGALLALYNNTPIAQPTTAYAAATYVNNAGTPITNTDTFDGYTLAQIVRIIKDLALT